MMALRERSDIMRLTLLAAGLALMAAVLPAAAEDGMTFYIRNQSDRAVAMELHGKGADRVWPGGGQAYLLEGQEKKSVLIDCVEGENICYGAWAHGDDRIAWGVGPDNNRDCADCCWLCVWKTTTTVDLGE
jgi:hypothetical protein